jgi:hypothetical protein
MALQDDVLRILRGASVSRIRFRFPAVGGDVTIAPQTFHVVIRAIEDGRVHVARATDLAAGVGAQYNDVARVKTDGSTVRANTIEIASTSGRFSEAAVLHESLHAAYDLLRTGIIVVDEEASALMVTLLHLKMTGMTRARWNAEPFLSAGRAVDTLLAQYAQGVAGIPMVGGTEWGVLKLAIMTTPIYLFPWASAGNFTVGPAVTGGSYPHDG